MNALATHATFLAPDLLDLPPDPVDATARAEGDAAEEVEQAEPVEPVPPGARLATTLADALGAHGWRVLYRWTTPYGHAFDCSRAETRYDVELRLIDADGRWLVWATPRTGLMRRLFKRGAGDTTEHALLLTHLGAILGADSRVSGLSWTEAADAPTLEVRS